MIMFSRLSPGISMRKVSGVRGVMAPGVAVMLKVSVKLVFEVVGDDIC